MTIEINLYLLVSALVVAFLLGLCLGVWLCVRKEPNQMKYPNNAKRPKVGKTSFRKVDEPMIEDYENGFAK